MTPPRGPLPSAAGLSRRRCLQAAGWALPAVTLLAAGGCAAGAAAPAGRRTGAEPADGFAALEGGTLFDPGLPAASCFDVRTRAELDAALRLGERPKLLRIHGCIDLAAGRGAADFADPLFDFDAYCRAYAPAVWGRRPLSGPLEEARARSVRRQAAAVVVQLPPHTALSGATPDAGFINGSLMLESTHHVVLRDLRLHGVLDHFPAWDPLDGREGEWNSEYDAVSVRRSHHLWVDHCHLESTFPSRRQVFGRRFEQNDGLLDITRASDLVTVSWCRFVGHDKTMLIGGSDNHTEDAGRLRVSLLHNHWLRCAERTPRVRFGRVQVVNNLFEVPDAAGYGYSLGVGHHATLLSDANAWQTAGGVPAQRLARLMARSAEGARFSDRGSLHNGAPVDLAALLRASHPALGAADGAGAGAEWPALREHWPAAEAAARVRASAGPRPISDNGK